MSERDTVGSVLSQQGYTEPIRILFDETFNAHAAITLEDFETELRRGHGAFWLFTHGNESALAVEAYDTTLAGRQASRDAFEDYAAAGWDTVSQIKWGRSVHGFDIAVRPGLVSSPDSGFVGRESIVYVAACDSWDWRDAWSGARDYLGYTPGNDLIIQMKADAMFFWGRLNGEDGKSYRVVETATSGRHMSHIHNGDGGTVLAPTVLNYHPSSGVCESSITSFTCSVYFDCVMDATAGVETVTADGFVCYVDSVFWPDSTTLEFTVHGSGQNGTGTIYIDPFCVMSGGNCANLDGNTYPPDSDGNGPNEDQYVFSYDFKDNQAASISLFSIDGNEVVWLATEESGTLAYRLLGQNAGDGEQWEVISPEFTAQGGPHEYREPLPAAWDYIKLQEKEERYWGTRWIDHDICASHPQRPECPPAEQRSGPPWLRFFGFEEDADAIGAFLDHARAGGVDGDYRIVPAISDWVLEQVFSSGRSADTLRLIWPRPAGYDSGGCDGRREWGVGLVGPEDFESVLGAYEIALEDTNHSLPGDVYQANVYLIGGPEDSAYVADCIKYGHEEYWILFGNVVGCNDSPGTTTPCPYLKDAPRPVGHGRNCIFSLWNWECGPYDTTQAEKFIGYVPADDEDDVWTYFDKMMEYGWNYPWSEYGCAFGGWVLDEDWGGRSGVYVRAQMDSIITAAGRCGWTSEPLWASGLSTTAQVDSAVAALNGGRSIVVVLGTLANVENLCFWMSTDPDDAAYVDVATDLGYSHKYCQLLGLSCDLYRTDYENQHPRIVEQLLRVPRGGAVASVACSGGFYQDYYYFYIMKFLEIYDQQGGDLTLGQMHNEVRNALLADNPDDPLMPLFCKVLPLLGDPTIKAGGPNSSMYLAVEEGRRQDGSRFALKNPVPNPFNPTVAVSFSLPDAHHISLRIYNIRGQLVRSLLDGWTDAGEHQVVWDGKNENGEMVGSGVYFCQLVSGGHSQTTKLVLLK